MAASVDPNYIEEIKRELAEAGKFLKIKTTAQQLRDGVKYPTDTAFVESVSGQLLLKAVFDVNGFSSDEINVQIVDNVLELEACGFDDQEHTVFRKTLRRQIELPEGIEASQATCLLSLDHILTISMPIYLPSTNSSAPPSANAVAIETDESGKKFMTLRIYIGPEFTMDDVKVGCSERSVVVLASYEAMIGQRGCQITRRESKKEYKIPQSNIEIESYSYDFKDDGVLVVTVWLKDQVGEPYRCRITCEDL